MEIEGGLVQKSHFIELIILPVGILISAFLGQLGRIARFKIDQMRDKIPKLKQNRLLINGMISFKGLMAAIL